jgi:predicted nucleotidyltransferase
VLVLRGFRDRDFIESIEGLIFCVIGNIHPKDRVVSYLKYVPYLESRIRVKWSRNGVMYGRILPFYSATGVKNTFDFLKKYYPQYTVFDEYRSIELIEVPKDRIKKHYKPEERLNELLKEPRDYLEVLAKELIEKLSYESRVPLDYFGVTGSILLKIHNPQISDIDIVIYGKENSYIVRETLIKLLDNESSGFSRPKGETLESWAEDITRIHPLTFEEAKTLYSRYKWNRALYKGKQFSIHPVKLDNEVNEEWEQKIFKPIGLVTVRARVIDSSESIFMPSIYIVDNVKVLEGDERGTKVKQIVSYEGLYIDLAKPGEEIIARGKLEEVHDLKRNISFYQVTIGTYEAQGKDYIKPVEWFKR